MRMTLLAVLVVVPSLALGQSLAEVAKKEKSRREKNKQEGREAQVISESDLGSGSQEGQSETTSEEVPTSASPSSGATSSEGSQESTSEGESEEDANVPAFIPPDIPLPEKLEMFERIKRQYERQVKEIDEAISKNDARLRELEAEIRATSASGGAGLPVPPQPGSGAVNQQLTGQESATLVAEQNRLQQANEGLRARKEELKTNVQAKGRAAGIPVGYLRF